MGLTRSEHKRVIDPVERTSRGGDGIVAAARLALPLRPIRSREIRVTNAPVDPE